MELERYRALLCAIEEGSLSAAAKTLGYTPSAISRMVSSLEEESGFPLLVRRREGVIPTQNCLRLLPAVRETLHAADKLAQLSAQIRGADTGTVTIGLAYHTWYVWLSRVVSDFHRVYPGIQIRFSSAYSAELTRQLSAREIDLCIISRRQGDHGWIPLRQDPLMAMVPAAHPLAQAERVPISAYEREPFIEIYSGVETDNANAFARNGIHPNTCYSISDVHAAYSMVEAGLGISMNNALNSRLWTGGVKFLPLDPPQMVEIGIATDPAMSPAARTFIEFARPYFRELTEEAVPR
ncbi:MAG: LysR family transcriptional regulator [Oscillospiraceae bacterium]|nr:LysR family transcriptional regulator [Oscillospiraceae bacterium]